MVVTAEGKQVWTLQPSLLAAVLTASGIVVYVGTQTGGDGLDPVLRTLLALILLIPPVGLSSVAALVTTRVTSSRWLAVLAVLADGVGWALGGATTGLLWVLAYHEPANLYFVGLCLAIVMPFYLVSLLLRLVAGPQRYPRLTRSLSIVAMSVAVAVLILRAVAG